MSGTSGDISMTVTAPAPQGTETVPASGEREEIKLPMPAWRQPRGGAMVNGKRVDHLLVDARVLNNSYFQADSFRLSLAMQDTGELNSRYFTDGDALEVEIFSGEGVQSKPSNSLILGWVDDVDVDLGRRVLTLTGRDFTADLLEAKTTEKYPNKTASEIVRIIAAERGLTPVVTDTTQTVGHYYSREHARLTDDTTQWNLLTYLAEQEGMDVFVRGRELHFSPPPDMATAPRWTLEYRPSSDSEPIARAPATRLMLRRSMTLARDLSVRVVSWNSQQKRALDHTANTRLIARGTTRGQFGSRTRYVFRIPGLTQEQVIREAERRLADLSRHERVVTAEIPGDPRINTRIVMTLRGTGTSFDQDYRLDEIEHRISQKEGHSMTVTAKNMAPQSTAAL